MRKNNIFVILSGATIPIFNEIIKYKEYHPNLIFSRFKINKKIDNCKIIYLPSQRGILNLLKSMFIFKNSLKLIKKPKNIFVPSIANFLPNYLIKNYSQSKIHIMQEGMSIFYKNHHFKKLPFYFTPLRLVLGFLCGLNYKIVPYSDHLSGRDTIKNYKYYWIEKRNDFPKEVLRYKNIKYLKLNKKIISRKTYKGTIIIDTEPGYFFSDNELWHLRKSILNYFSKSGPIFVKFHPLVSKREINKLKYKSIDKKIKFFVNKKFPETRVEDIIEKFKIKNIVTIGGSSAIFNLLKAGHPCFLFTLIKNDHPPKDVRLKLIKLGVKLIKV